MLFSSPQKDGFTLLEVMLAVMIFAIAVLGLLTTLSTTIEAAGDFNRESRVALSLQNQLAEARELDFRGEQSETVGPDEMGVIYKREIVPIELQNRNGQPLNRLFAIRITATWGLAGPDETQIAEVYVYKP